MFLAQSELEETLQSEQCCENRKKAPGHHCKSTNSAANAGPIAIITP
jgi:hypothetical protein